MHSRINRHNNVKSPVLWRSIYPRQLHQRGRGKDPTSRRASIQRRIFNELDQHQQRRPRGMQRVQQHLSAHMCTRVSGNYDVLHRAVSTTRATSSLIYDVLYIHRQSSASTSKGEQYIMTKIGLREFIERQYKCMQRHRQAGSSAIVTAAWCRKSNDHVCVSFSIFFLPAQSTKNFPEVFSRRVNGQTRTSVRRIQLDLKFCAHNRVCLSECAVHELFNCLSSRVIEIVLSAQWIVLDAQYIRRAPEYKTMSL